MITLLNSSPHGAKGNTAFALKVIADTLHESGFETETLEIGRNGYKGCQACGACSATGKCAFSGGDNVTNGVTIDAIAEKFAGSEAIVIGSPVYYAGINGTLKTVLDRVFYSGGKNLRYKPAAAVVAARRAGTTAALEQIYKYFEIAELLVAPSTYWNGVHGRAAGETEQDTEGLQLMRVTARNIAYLINTFKNAPPPPDREPKIMYNFIRSQD
jgi:multimeric flavodoxin WrbA